MAAGEKVQRTGSLLVEQLKRYLDERVWMENKRIMQLIGAIERQAVAVKDAAPAERVFAWMTLGDERNLVEVFVAGRTCYRRDSSLRSE